MFLVIATNYVHQQKDKYQNIFWFLKKTTSISDQLKLRSCSNTTDGTKLLLAITVLHYQVVICSDRHISSWC